ncbi:hypothetical protein HKI87_11g67210 [Chloropicon roscoffensis]|uniref:Uncharacterized protein n=1 Tax=Chloropicon roscoffensis TaxID=1461544 RepID=A0AAX4PHG1_9CHLO
MDLHQQVKNSLATLENAKVKKRQFQAENLNEPQHRHAMQGLSDGTFTSYQQTLRIVEHSGDRASWSEKLQTRKHPGYIRNEFGGFFTS